MDDNNKEGKEGVISFIQGRVIKGLYLSMAEKKVKIIFQKIRNHKISFQKSQVSKISSTHQTPTNTNSFLWDKS